MTSGNVEDDENRSIVTDHQHHSQSTPPPPSQGFPNYPPPLPLPQATGFPYPAQSSVEDDNNRSAVTYHQHYSQQPPPPFEGFPYYPPPPQHHQPPATGFPLPAQPYFPGYAVDGGMPVTEHHRRLCCGRDARCVILIIGFFFIAIIWYIIISLELFSTDPQFIQDI